ncbi:MAG: histidine phosphatase family protein [Candidatus Kariarchaeaceae archaeon]|jgi:uncharacterized phosphatase
MKVYLIRHGESEGNREGMITTNPQLTELGLKQAKILQNVLPLKYDKAYSSNLQRAKMTAMISLNLYDGDRKLRIEPDLREIEVTNNLEGLRFEDLEASKDDFMKWAFLIEDTFHEKFQTESIPVFIKRTGDAFKKIVNEGKKDNNETILIFSHGATMRSILSRNLQLIDPEDLTILNTEIISLKLENSNWNLIERITNHVKTEP